jgi:hypothetical protein
MPIWPIALTPPPPEAEGSAPFPIPFREVQAPRNFRAVWAFLRNSGSEETASACTEDMRVLDLAQRAAIRSVAALEMFGLGEVAREDRTSRVRAGVEC